MRNLYSAGFNQDEIREIFRLINWMMHLRLDLDRRFKSDLVAYKKELKMPYITSVERLAKEDGREEGREDGLEKGLRRILAGVFYDALSSTCSLSIEIRSVGTKTAIFFTIAISDSLQTAGLRSFQINLGSQSLGFGFEVNCPVHV